MCECVIFYKSWKPKACVGLQGQALQGQAEGDVAISGPANHHPRLHGDAHLLVRHSGAAVMCRCAVQPLQVASALGSAHECL